VLKLEPSVITKMRNVPLTPERKVVNRRNSVAAFKKPVTQVTPYKAGTARDQDVQYILLDFPFSRTAHGSIF
jgi:hypothetical protein